MQKCWADGPEPLTQEGLQVCDVASMGILVKKMQNPLRFFATPKITALISLLL